MAAEARGSAFDPIIFSKKWTYDFIFKKPYSRTPNLRGKSLNSVLYDAWASCGEGNWTSSKFLLRIRERHTCKRRGVRKWLTKFEIFERFGEDLGQQVINRKILDDELQKKEVRVNPNLPGNKDHSF